MMLCTSPLHMLTLVEGNFGKWVLALGRSLGNYPEPTMRIPTKLCMNWGF